VADALRTAVYYTEIDLNPAKAMKAYREALHIALYAFIALAGLRSISV
jgi:hypothetical protein